MEEEGSCVAPKKIMLVGNDPDLVMHLCKELKDPYAVEEFRDITRAQAVLMENPEQFTIVGVRPGYQDFAKPFADSGCPVALYGIATNSAAVLQAAGISQVVTRVQFLETVKAPALSGSPA